MNQKKPCAWRVLVRVTIGILVAGEQMFGSSGFPVIRLSSSQNMRFVVVTDLEIESTTTAAQRIKSIHLNVAEQESFPNPQDHVTGSFTSWHSGGAGSTIPLDDYGGNPPLVVISNDGQWLVVICVAPATSGGQEALRIYRREAGGYRIQRKVLLGDVLTPTQIDPSFVPGVSQLPATSGASEASPEWFAGGSFDINEKHNHFLYRTRWGNTIDLELAL